MPIVSRVTKNRLLACSLDPTSVLPIRCAAETYRRAVARGVQVSIPSALRAVQSDIAPLAVCLVDAIAASEKMAG